MADGTASASRVVGSEDFERPTLPVEDGNGEVHVVSGVSCEMPYTIKFSHTDNDGKIHKEVEKLALEVFDLARRTFSTYHKKSEVCHINSLEPGVTHRMSTHMRTVLIAADEVYRKTRGAYDPGLKPLFESYAGIATALRISEREDNKGNKKINFVVDDNKRGPLETPLLNNIHAVLQSGFGLNKKVNAKVEKIKEVATWLAFAISEDKKFISKLRSGAKLDLNGISKGWAIDELSRRLIEDLGLRNTYVDWAGDIKVSGNHPSGRKWTVNVVEPPSLNSLATRAKKSGVVTVNTYDDGSETKNETSYLAVISLEDGQAIATSGDYEQVYARNNRLYSHVISPIKGGIGLKELSDSNLAQTVIICNSCMFADALATASLACGTISDARILLDHFRTGFHVPMKDFMLYSREGPRIVKMTVPGVESEKHHKMRMERHDKANVIVVGSGLAGMSAAVEAAEAGAEVTILEKEKKTGGNSAKATSGINGWGTETQAVNGIGDEERYFERDTFLSGKGGMTDHSLVRVLSTKSSSAVHWLMHKFKIPLTVLSQLGGHSARRTHRAPPDQNGNPRPIGFLIMQTIRQYIETHYKDSIKIMTECEVTKFETGKTPEGSVFISGVTYKHKGKKHKLNADSVVLATGGFGCDSKQTGFMSKHRPDLLGFPTTNGSFATGDGMRLAADIGANLVDMDKVQLHPTGFIDPKDPFNPTKYLAPEAIRGSGGVLVNLKGERFINELDLRSVVSKGILDHGTVFKQGKQTGSTFAWVILSKEAQGLFGEPVLRFYKDKLGLFEEAKTVGDAAEIIGCSKEVLAVTLREYARSKENGICPKTNKTVFPSYISDTETDLILARVTPSIHYCMGGVQINASGEVMKANVNPLVDNTQIQGLFAAGEVTGGVHGNNRLGGNSLLECVVFGRIAGERAGTINQKEKNGLLEDRWTPCVVREIRNTDSIYGKNTRELRLNLSGSLQHSGMKVGQFLSIKGSLDGDTLTGYFSPITRPTDEGVVGILCRTDFKGGPIVNLLDTLRPGNDLLVKAMGGLKLDFNDDGIFWNGRSINTFGLLAGGTGLAPMVQIILEYINYIEKRKLTNATAENPTLNLLYAAEEEADLAYKTMLENFQNKYPDIFRWYPVLNSPPLGWTDGVGFVTPNMIRDKLFYPPKDDQMIVMCGPPIFEKIMTGHLNRLGFDDKLYYGFS